MHFLMGEQTYLVVSPPRCFAFREFDQRATNALPVKTWVHRDIIQKQVVGLRDAVSERRSHRYSRSSITQASCAWMCLR